VTLEEYEVLSRAVNELDSLLDRVKGTSVLTAEQFKKSMARLIDAQEILVDESERRYGDYDISDLLPGPNILVFRRDQPIGRV
jgi:hypothetical protein